MVDLSGIDWKMCSNILSYLCPCQLEPRRRVGKLTLLEEFLATNSRLKVDRLPYTDIGASLPPIGPIKTYLNPTLDKLHWSPMIAYRWTIEAAFL